METGFKAKRRKKNMETMKELSLHILDIVQNSIQANASKIEITITEDNHHNSMVIQVADNGNGMTDETLRQVLDPFYTTKNKKTGLGIPLLKQHAEMTGGDLTIKSSVDFGTKITAKFVKNHFDRQPIGNIAATLTSLIRSNPSIHFKYLHQVDEKKFELDTNELLDELDGIQIDNPEIIRFLEQMINENLSIISTG
jgi:DNA topoisomerase VI subunit B